MTVVGRSKLDHPALGTTGGSALHSSIETMWTAVSDHLGSRFKSYSSQSNSTTVTYEHNFGKDLSTLQVHIYTGSAGSLTKVKDPTASGWVIAATSGFLKTKVDVTTPSTGGPHTFVVSVHEDEKSLDNLSITGTAGQGYVDVTTQSSAPSSPASGDVRIYSKTDGKLYKKDSSGNEAAVGAGSGSGGVNYLVDWYDATKAVGTVSTVAVGGNVTVSGSFPAVTSAWYADTTSGSAAIASSSDNTLRSTANYLTALSGVSTSGATFVQSPVFNIDGKDLGTALTVQFDVSGNTTDNDWDVVAVRYNSSGVYQELIPIAGNVSTMTGTPSAKLPLGVKQFNGFFITGSTASDVYAIRWRRRAGSAQIRLDSLTVGPDQVLQGAIVTDWQTYTPAVSGMGTINSLTARYRRVGSSLEVLTSFGAGPSGSGPTAADFTIDLPTGLNHIYSGNDQLLTGSCVTSYASATQGGIFPLALAGATTKVYWTHNNSRNGTTKLAGNSIAVNDSNIRCSFSIPIAEWQSNTQQAARAVEEYASNTGTEGTTPGTTYSNSSFFRNGPDGSKFPNITTVDTTTGSTKYYVQWQTPHLPTDSIVVEIREPGTTNWYPAAFPFTRQGTSSYGASYVALSSTQGYVQFGRAGIQSSGGTYAATGNGWSNLYSATDSLSYYWRVRKVSSGAAVGFPVGARNIIGDTTGTAVPAGYVGEVLSQTRSKASAVTLSTGAASNVTATQLTLTPGVWEISGVMGWDIQSTTSLTVQWAAIGTSSATLPTDIAVQNADGSIATVWTQTATTGQTDRTMIIPPVRVTLSANKDFWLVAQATFTIGFAKAYGTIRAIRIA